MVVAKKNVKKKQNNKTKKGKAKNKSKLIIILSILFVVVLGICFDALYFNTNLRCKDGYNLHNNRCEKIISMSPSVTRYCGNGYQMVDDVCTKIEVAVPKIEYYCDNTYKDEGDIVVSASTLKGEQCVYTMSHVPVQKRTCLYGASPYSDTQCRIAIPTRAPSRVDPKTGKVTYYCVGSQELIGTTCYTYGYSDYQYDSICVDSFSLTNGRCVKYFSYEASWKAYCPEGYTFVDKNTCTKTVTAIAKLDYNCLDGYYLEHKKCKKILYQE